MLVLPAQITHEQAAACAAMLRAAMAPLSGDVVVDASALTEFDSSALAVLLDCRRDALAAGRGFAVSGLPPRLDSLARLYGVAPMLPAASLAA